jgi:hypothetical protein
MCFHKGFLRFTAQLCDFSLRPSCWDLRFSSVSQMGASTRKRGSQFGLGEIEPSFKDILASAAMMRLGLLSLNLTWFV